MLCKLLLGRVRSHRGGTVDGTGRAAASGAASIPAAWCAWAHRRALVQCVEGGYAVLCARLCCAWERREEEKKEERRRKKKKKKKKRKRKGRKGKKRREKEKKKGGAGGIRGAGLEQGEVSM